ncbi:hypothetical protein D3C80_2147700 [compost metagenome]
MQPGDWTHEYATGIPVIDSQHRKLFDYLKEIEPVIARKDARNLQIVRQGVINYAISQNTFE